MIHKYVLIFFEDSSFFIFKSCYLKNSNELTFGAYYDPLIPIFPWKWLHFSMY
jgi:hypothetical protein